MNRDARYRFRMSKVWKAFKASMKKEGGGVDWVTRRPLIRAWNLHHMDIRVRNYDNMSDPGRFRCLNPDTHKAVHWLYRECSRDPGTLDRLVKLIGDMRSMSGGE